MRKERVGLYWFTSLLVLGVLAAIGGAYEAQHSTSHDEIKQDLATHTIKYEVSNELHTEGIVVDKIYTPHKKGVDIMDNAPIFGFGWGIILSEAPKPETYMITVRWRYGQYKLNDKNLFQQFAKDQKVKLIYKEKYKSTYVTRGGIDTLIEKQLIGTELVSVNQIPKK